MLHHTPVFQHMPINITLPNQVPFQMPFKTPNNVPFNVPFELFKDMPPCHYYHNNQLYSFTPYFKYNSESVLDKFIIISDKIHICFEKFLEVFHKLVYFIAIPVMLTGAILLSILL